MDQIYDLCFVQKCFMIVLNLAKNPLSIRITPTDTGRYFIFAFFSSQNVLFSDLC